MDENKLELILIESIERIKRGKEYIKAFKDFDKTPNEATHHALNLALYRKYIADKYIIGDFELQMWVKFVETGMVKEAKQLRVHSNDTHILYVQRGRRPGERAYLTVKAR